EIGDVIVAVDGQPVDRVSQLQRVPRTHYPGQTLAVDVMRYGTSKSFRVRIAERPIMAVANQPPRVERPSENFSYDRLGISVTPWPGSGMQPAGRGTESGVHGLRVTDIAPDGP